LREALVAEVDEPLGDLPIRQHAEAVDGAQRERLGGGFGEPLRFGLMETASNCPWDCAESHPAGKRPSARIENHREPLMDRTDVQRVNSSRAQNKGDAVAPPLLKYLND